MRISSHFCFHHIQIDIEHIYLISRRFETNYCVWINAFISIFTFIGANNITVQCTSYVPYRYRSQHRIENNEKVGIEKKEDVLFMLRVRRSKRRKIDLLLFDVVMRTSIYCHFRRYCLIGLSISLRTNSLHSCTRFSRSESTHFDWAKKKRKKINTIVGIYTKCELGHKY